jgi:hypothetical protein
MFLVLRVAYVFFSALIVASSMRLWFQVPLELTRFEFDYFLGLFWPANPNLVGFHLLIGRLLHFTLFCIIGFLFWSLASRFSRNQESLTVAGISGYAALLSAVYAFGMPWVSPDVFFYVGSGWLEGHYGLSPYIHGASDATGFMRDEMFGNIFPGFLGGTTTYGPLFQKLSEGVALLSGGSEKLALAFYKIINLGIHAGASYLVYRIAPKSISRLALFCYAANPIILFSLLTCAHNDHLMNFSLLLSFFLLRERRAFLCGFFLGAATSFKYFPIVFLPIFVCAVFFAESKRNLTMKLAAAGLLILGFVVVVIGAHSMYPESLPKVANTISEGIQVYRNSIYHVLSLLSDIVIPVSFESVLRATRTIYVISYITVFIYYLSQMRKDWFFGAIKVSLIVAVLYFIIVNKTNQEWYVTWLLGLAFVLPGEHFRRFGLQLSALFLPLVIFTVKNSPQIVILSNLALYFLVLGCGVLLLWRTWVARRSTDA